MKNIGIVELDGDQDMVLCKKAQGDCTVTLKEDDKRVGVLKAVFSSREIFRIFFGFRCAHSVSLTHNPKEAGELGKCLARERERIAFSEEFSE